MQATNSDNWTKETNRRQKSERSSNILIATQVVDMQKAYYSRPVCSLFSNYLSLRPLGVSMQELGDVSHDGLLIGGLDVHILRIQKPGDSKLDLGDVEGGLQPRGVGLALHRGQVDTAFGNRGIQEDILKDV